jgi:hypothetical protein
MTVHEGDGMMMISKAARVAETLAGCAASLEQRGPVHWIFSPIGGADLSVKARIQEDWLALTSRLPERRYEPSAAALWGVLLENGKLPGGVKLARLPGEKEFSACAELRLDDEIDLHTRLGQVCAGLRAAGAVHPAVPENGEMTVPSPSSDLRELCGETGWTWTQRPSGGLVVDLDVRSGFHQAMLEERAGGRVVVTTQLASRDGDGPERCRQALGLLLLRACAVVRMARAAADAVEGQTKARFEVAFDTAPCAPELTHALCSLTTACGLCAKEAELLESDERIARQYLCGFAAAESWLRDSQTAGTEGRRLGECNTQQQQP